MRRAPRDEGWLVVAVRESHPRFVEAVLADVDAALAYRGEPPRRGRVEGVRETIRLVLTSDTFGAQCCYRAKAACQRRGMVLTSALFHRLAIVTGQICIGDPVQVEPGIYIPHGQVVVDGFTRVARGAVLSPFVTLGLVAGHPEGPTLEQGVHVGTGAKVIGPVTVGTRARIGAGAVVVADVAPGAVAVGVPARTVAAGDDA